MSETDAEFLKRMGELRIVYAGGSPGDWDRLLRLATRGAAVPDEPTEAMIAAGKAVPDREDPVWLSPKRPTPSQIYRAMLTAALKEERT